MTRLLVVRLGSLGDLVHTLPAVAALHRAHPDAVIDWLVDAPHRPFLELVPILSSIVVLRERGARGWLEARRTLRARQYDVAVDFQGLLKSAALGRLSGARRVVGFDRAAAREGAAAVFYGERVAVSGDAHVIQKNMALASALGAASDAIEFPIRAVPSPAVTAFVADLGSAYAVLNTGAAWPNKRWPADRLGAVARHLRERHGLASVVLWGPGERDAAHAAVDASGGAARMAPEIGLVELTALVAGARLMVSGDTGPTHIAGAVGVPIVAVFGPTNPRRNGPWNPADVVLSRYDACDCHYERRCRRDAAGWCLGRITLDEVVAAVDERMRRVRATA